VNEYVAGGWGAAAGMLALYAWRVVYRGRKLSRAFTSSPALPWLRTGPPAPVAEPPELAASRAAEAETGR
jgi:hypothetical protein